MDKKYPFKFLDSYNQNDTDIFFGRDEEIEALYEMVFQNSMLLVYGASGTGKTSLIQCGLAGRFKSYDWLALTIRRGTNINESLEKTLIAAGGDEIDDEEARSNDSSKKLTGLLRLIKGVYLNSFKPIYLIFDQFEELYILGTKEEQEKFIKAIKEIQGSEQPVKMIFSIREEYLGHLFEFEKQVPQLLRKKLRVEPMTLNKVTDVIKGINTFSLSNVKIKADEIDAITQGIFERLRGKKKTLTIQLPYLQVFLDKLYLETTKDESRKADALIELSTLNRIGDIGDVLRNFLEEQVAGISQKLSQDNRNATPETIWKILSPFSTLEGTKEPISKKELGERLKDIDPKLINEAVESFVNSRILNYSESSNLYELAHDSLALRIAEKRSDEDISLLEVRRLIKNQVSLKQDARELFSKKQLNFIEPYLHKLNLTEEEEELVKESKEAEHKADRKRKARRRSIIISIAAITIFVIAGLSYFLIQQSIAKNKNIELLSNSYWNNSKSKKAENDYVYSLANAAMAFSISKDRDFKENILMEMESKWPAVILKNILTGKNQILAAAYTNDGKHIITLNKYHTFTIWNALTGDSVGSAPKMLYDEKGQRIIYELSPDGKFVIIPKMEGKIRLWNIAASKMIEMAGEQEEEYMYRAIHSEVSRDGSKYLNVAFNPLGGRKIDLFESNGKKSFSKALDQITSQFDWENNFKASFSGNGKFIAVKYDDNRIIIVNALSGESDSLNLMELIGQSDLDDGRYSSLSDYNSPVKSISFDNEGKTILTANSDSTLRLWDAITGRQKGSPMKHDRAVDKAYFSPDGSMILSIDEENSTFIWDTKTTTKLGHAFKLESGSTSPVFSPDGKNILTVINGTVSIWQLLERKNEDEEELSNDAFYEFDFSKNNFFSPDLKKMVIKKIKKGVFTYRLFDAETKKPIGQEITSKYYYSRFTDDDAVWFSPDSKRLITRNHKDSILLWNADLATRIGDIIPLDSTGYMFFSPVQKKINDNKKTPDIKKLITMQDKDTAVVFQLWNIDVGKKIGKEIVRKKTYNQPVQNTEDSSAPIDYELSEPPQYRFAAPVFSADGSRFLIFYGPDDSLYYELFDASTGLQKGSRYFSTAVSTAPLLSPDGTSVFAPMNDSTAQFLDTESGKLKGDVFRYNAKWDPVYSSDGKWLLICNSDSTAQFIDGKTWRKKGDPIKNLNSDFTPYRPLISPDASRVITFGNTGTIHLWDVETQKHIKEDIKHEYSFISPEFSPDGKLFLTSDSYGTARLYDAKTGNQKGPALKHPKSEIRGIAFSGNSKKVLIIYQTSNQSLSIDITGVIWDITTGKQIGQELKGISLPSYSEQSIYTYLSFSEDGKWLRYNDYYDDQLLNTEAGDLDIPADLLKLQVLMSSGYNYDFSLDEKNIITSNEFYDKDGLKEKYHDKAVAHYRHCKFTKYNLWKRFNEEEAKKIRPDDFIENKKDSTESEFQILTSFNTSSDTSKTNNGSYLEPNQAIYSSNKKFLLAYQEDGNLVIYNKENMKPLWASNTKGYPAYRTIMQYDGNLVIYAGDPGKALGNFAIWSSDTWENNAGARVVLEDDGKLVIYNAYNKIVWDSDSGKRVETNK